MSRSRKWESKNKEYIRRYQKEWYLKNKGKYRTKYLKKYRDRKRYIQDYKLSKGCSICGYNKCAAALDFHHNGNKEFDIGNASCSLDIEKLDEEMRKCIVLCRNCHAELHEKNKEVV